MKADPPATRPPDTEEIRDLGFGAVVAGESRMRLLNRDGSFNVSRRGLGFASSLSPYHSLLTMAWWKFLGLVAGSYLVVNALFAAAYVLCGPAALQGSPGDDRLSPYFQAFFFSVETFATIGYGHVHPSGMAANALMTVESLVGLLGFALATGLLFSRFARPTAKILFSRQAVIAPYRGGTAFEFRIANQRTNEIVELEAKVLLSLIERADGRRTRRFHELRLERQRVTFFPLNWTIVHPIDESSPFHGLTQRDLLGREAEVLILLSGLDETFSQTVHARSSYRAEEIVWNARFTDVFDRDDRRGTLQVDISRLHGIAPVGAGAGASEGLRPDQGAGPGAGVGAGDQHSRGSADSGVTSRGEQRIHE